MPPGNYVDPYGDEEEPTNAGWGSINERLRPGARSGTIHHGGQEYYEFEYQPGDPGHPGTTEEGNQPWVCKDCGAQQPAEQSAVHRGRPYGPPNNRSADFAGPLCPGCTDKPPAMNTWTGRYGKVTPGRTTPEHERWHATPAPRPPGAARGGASKPPREEGPYTGEPASLEDTEPRPWTGHDIKESTGYCNPFAC